MTKIPLLKNPIFILTLIYGSASMGLFTSFTFYYFQHYLQDRVFTFFVIYFGIILANLIGLRYGFNISRSLMRSIIYVSCCIQLLSFPLIYFIYSTHITITILVLMITGFFDALIGLYLIPRANRVKSYQTRLRHNILLWGFLYLGMTIFGILFIINIAFAFLFAILATFIGSISLFKLIQEDKDLYSNFKRESVKQVFQKDYLAYLVLFTMYFMFFFSMISIIAFSKPYISQYSNNSLLIFLIPLLVTNSVIPLTLWYKLNRRFPLRSIFNLTYVVSSVSIILIYNNPDFLLYAYLLELWTWSIYQIYIFTNIGDTFPGLRNIQPINFWWLMLALSVGLGISLPLLIPNKKVLLPFMLVLMLASIALFTFLKSFKQPYKIFVLLIQTKNGQTLVEKEFSDFKLNTDFFSGVFKATKILFKESFKSSTDFLRSIEYENKTLILCESESFYSIAISDRYDKNIRNILLDITNMFEVTYYHRLKKLDLSEQKMNSFNLNISDLPIILQQKINSLDSS